MRWLISRFGRATPISTVVDDLVDALHSHLTQPAAVASAQPPRNVPVALGDRAYDIVIGKGVLAQAGGRIATIAPRLLARSSATRMSRRSTCRPWRPVSPPPACVIPASSCCPARAPCYAQFEKVCEAVIAAKIERGDIVVALGRRRGRRSGGIRGGVGPARRSLRAPTTRCCRRSIRRSAARWINSAHGKNLVGFLPTFWCWPTQGVVDAAPAEFRAGYAEGWPSTA